MGRRIFTVRRLKLFLLAAVLATLFALPVSALAHDVGISLDFPDFSAYQINHEDQDPFKGWLTITAANTSNTAWGDFHFKIFDFMGVDISNVDFGDSGLFAPQSSQSPLTWDIDNVVVGAEADLFFYSDPVLPGETAWFKVYTYNPDHVNFGVMFYPTPAPLPAAAWLLGSGLVALVGLRRKLK